MVYCLSRCSGRAEKTNRRWLPFRAPSNWVAGSAGSYRPLPLKSQTGMEHERKRNDTASSQDEFLDLRETSAWLKISEPSFDLWNNGDDAVYDSL